MAERSFPIRPRSELFVDAGMNSSRNITMRLDLENELDGDLSSKGPYFGVLQELSLLKMDTTGSIRNRTCTRRGALGCR
jgi:hypothetical protein